MIEAYLQEREEHPHGVTASGLGVYIKTHGVLLEKGCLRQSFCAGTRWTLSMDGRYVIDVKDLDDTQCNPYCKRCG